MPDKSDFTVDGDEKHGWTVYRLVRVNRLQSKRGSVVGHVKLLDDRTYEPSGTLYRRARLGRLSKPSMASTSRPRYSASAR
jgi:hypothetical protein